MRHKVHGLSFPPRAEPQSSGSVWTSPSTSRGGDFFGLKTSPVQGSLQVSVTPTRTPLGPLPNNATPLAPGKPHHHDHDYRKLQRLNEGLYHQLQQNELNFEEVGRERRQQQQLQAALEAKIDALHAGKDATEAENAALKDELETLKRLHQQLKKPPPLAPPTKGINMSFSACANNKLSGDPHYGFGLQQSWTWAFRDDCEDSRPTVGQVMKDVKCRVKYRFPDQNPALTSSEPIKASDSVVELLCPGNLIKATGRTRSLFLGINYKGGDKLSGTCDIAILAMKEFTEKVLGFSMAPEDYRVLSDLNPRTGPATRKWILEALKWLVEGSEPGDRLFLYFTGHSTAAGAMCPQMWRDGGVHGEISRDEYQTLLKVNEGVHMISIFDTCYSGRALGLPYTFGQAGGREVKASNTNKVVTRAPLTRSTSAKHKGAYGRQKRGRDGDGRPQWR